VEVFRAGDVNAQTVFPSASRPNADCKHNCLTITFSKSSNVAWLHVVLRHFRSSFVQNLPLILHLLVQTELNA